MIFYGAVALLLFLILACEISTFRTGVPTVTSVPSVRRKMVELLAKEAQTRPLDILDLGSGTGKLALSIARALPASSVTGLEISPVPFVLSLLRRFAWGFIWPSVRRVRFWRKDFWSHPVSGHNVVTLYINGAIRERMAEKLSRELPAGALVISNETHLPGWTPAETHEVGTLIKVKVVVYRKEV